MEQAVGMETVLFGGPPEIGNVLKLANSQIGFMTIFAHPLFQNVSDIIPAMGFGAAEILTNKGVWFTKAELEKRKEQLRRDSDFVESGAISPRSQSPAGGPRKRLPGHKRSVDEKAKEDPANVAASPLKNVADASDANEEANSSTYVVPNFQSVSEGQPTDPKKTSLREPLAAELQANTSMPGSGNSPTSRRSSGALSGGKSKIGSQTPPVHAGKQSNTLPPSELQLGGDGPTQSSILGRGGSENQVPRQQATQSGLPSTSQLTGDMAADVGPPHQTSDSKASRTGLDEPGQESMAYATALEAPFTFATSRPSEPFRTYRPSTHAQVTASADPARASVPSLRTPDFDGTSATTSALATTSTGDVGQKTSAPALSASTEATSVLSAESEQGQATDKGQGSAEQGEGSLDFETKRARAASVPTRPQAPFSMSSQSSLDSSKQEMRTTGLRPDGPNGDIRSKGGTMPRRRSRIRLAFWRKRSDNGD